jgi:hypothetical protein
MFTPSQIKDRVRQQPFVPLRIVTSSGEAYEVRHPDLVWIGTRDIHVGMPSARQRLLTSNAWKLSLNWSG